MSQRQHFISRFRAQTLQLMLYNHFNAPYLQKTKYDLSQYYEVASDFSSFFVSVLTQIVNPVIKVVITLMGSSFNYSFSSVVVPILPLFVSFIITTRFAKSERAEAKLLRGNRSKTQ